MSTTGALANDGTVYLDAIARRRRIEPDGGGALTNSGKLHHRQRTRLSASRLRYGEFLRQQRDGRSDRQRGEFRRPQRVGSDDQQRLDFDRLRHRGARRSGRRHGVLQPLQRPIFSSTRAFRPGRPSPRPARTRSRSSRRSPSPPRSAVSGPATRSTRRTFVETATTYNFVENIAGTGGTLTLHDASSDRQYPDDRRLFELEFHPRPRQRDRHAGEVRLSRRRPRPKRA